MALTIYTQTEIPDYDTTDDVPAIITRIFNNIDWRFVLQANNAADRDSRYSNAPVGTTVVSPASKSAWCKLYDKPADVPAGESMWWTIGSDLGWNSNFFVEDSNNLWDCTGQWLCVRNGWVDIQLRITYVGAADIVPFKAYNGDAANSVIGSYPSIYAPKDFSSMGIGHVGSGANFCSQSDGRIALSGLTGTKVTQNDSFSIQGSWALGVY